MGKQHKLPTISTNTLKTASGVCNKIISWPRHMGCYILLEKGETKLCSALPCDLLAGKAVSRLAG